MKGAASTSERASSQSMSAARRPREISRIPSMGPVISIGVSMPRTSPAETKGTPRLCRAARQEGSAEAGAPQSRARGLLGGEAGRRRGGTARRRERTRRCGRETVIPLRPTRACTPSGRGTVALTSKAGVSARAEGAGAAASRPDRDQRRADGSARAKPARNAGDMQLLRSLAHQDRRPAGEKRFMRADGIHDERPSDPRHACGSQRPRGSL